jgi:hypothetical protein
VRPSDRADVEGLVTPVEYENALHARAA